MTILPVLRHVLQLVAGYFIASGHLDPESAEMWIGAGMSIGALVWYYLDSYRKRRATLTAEDQ